MTKNLLFAFISFFCFQNAFSQTFIRMEKVNGVYQIPCKVNGIEMKFIFDTGASDISISKTEANFLAKQGLLKEDDIIGKQKYRIADGSISEGTKIIIREIKIKDIFINDVNATVIDNDNAPLLFGQSALSKFGRYDIENDILRIFPKEKNRSFEFLGIDLTNSIEDFDLSPVNLIDANPVLAISFDSCKISKDHELKSLGFDVQNVIFNQEGQIFMIALSKNPDGFYFSDKKEFAKNFFNNLNEKISKLYGSSNDKMKNAEKWKNRDFEILTKIETDNTVGLFYIPKLFYNNDLLTSRKPSNENLIKNDQKVVSPQIQKLRKDITELINGLLESQSSYISRKFARIDSNNLEFHSEVKISYKGSENEASMINEMFAYYMVKQFIPSNDYKQMFIDCNFDNLIFRVQITDDKQEKYISIKKLHSNKLEEIKIPFTETELINTLE